MDSLFEFTTEESRSFWKKAFIYSLNKRVRKRTKIDAICIVVLLGICICCAIATNDILVGITVFVAFLTGVLCVFLAFPLIAASKARNYERTVFQKHGKTTLATSIFFYTDHFIKRTPDSAYKVFYSDISCLDETADLYIIETSEKWFAIDKKGIRKGNVGDFTRFIKHVIHRT